MAGAARGAGDAWCPARPARTATARPSTATPRGRLAALLGTGSGSISGGITLASGAAIGGGALTLSGPVGGAGRALTKVGTGTVRLSDIRIGDRRTSASATSPPSDRAAT